MVHDDEVTCKASAAFDIGIVETADHRLTCRRFVDR
jgi:hypothetical protein